MLMVASAGVQARAVIGDVNCAASSLLPYQRTFVIVQSLEDPTWWWGASEDSRHSRYAGHAMADLTCACSWRVSRRVGRSGR